MMRVRVAASLTLLFASFFTVVAVAAAQPTQEEPDFSRQQLFLLNKELLPQEQQFALPPAFRFPETVRPDSTFGIDVSHHVEDACRCTLDWHEISSAKVSFVYFKATEGIHFTDPVFLKYRDRLPELYSKEHLQTGVYHFLSPTEEPVDQAAYFLHAANVSDTQLPPTVDLEWSLGPKTANCPSDANVVTTDKQGNKIVRCDLWATLTADEIIGRVNSWIDSVRDATGRQPVLYTSQVWWNARIGDPKRIAEIHAAGLWVADYSVKGLATEHPRVPNSGPWAYWQFTDRAILPAATKNIPVDASIVSSPATAVDR